jgi:hypothetical protein
VDLGRGLSFGVEAGAEAWAFRRQDREGDESLGMSFAARLGLHVALRR